MVRTTIGAVVMLLLASCATQTRVGVPGKVATVGSPQLTSRGLVELDLGGNQRGAIQPQGGMYYTQVGKAYRVIADVQAATSQIVRLYRRYEWWTRTATTDGLLVAYDYADDLRHIPACCTSIWGGWVPERNTSALVYLKIHLWAADERARMSNSVSLAPIVVGTRGVSYSWP